MDFTKNKLRNFFFTVFVAITSYDLYLYGWIQKTNLAPWLSAFVASISLMASYKISTMSYRISQSSYKTAREALEVNKRNSIVGIIKDLTSRIDDEFKEIYNNYKDFDAQYCDLMAEEYCKCQTSLFVLLTEITSENKEYNRKIFIAYVSKKVLKELSSLDIAKKMFEEYSKKVDNISEHTLFIPNLKGDIKFLEKTSGYIDTIYNQQINIIQIAFSEFSVKEFVHEKFPFYEELKIKISVKKQILDEQLRRVESRRTKSP